MSRAALTPHLLKKFRLEKSRLQTELAEMFHVHRSTVSRWKLGKTWPDENLLQRMDEIFGACPGWFDEETGASEDLRAQFARLLQRVSIGLER